MYRDFLKLLLYTCLCGTLWVLRLIKNTIKDSVNVKHKNNRNIKRTIVQIFEGGSLNNITRNTLQKIVVKINTEYKKLGIHP